MTAIRTALTALKRMITDRNPIRMSVSIKDRRAGVSWRRTESRRGGNSGVGHALPLAGNWIIFVILNFA